MSGYPGGGHHDQYDDGYGRQPQGGNQQGGNTDSYYQDDQYYDQGYDNHGRNEGYYDES
jgi:1,3-beta-glucan synthase